MKKTFKLLVTLTLLLFVGFVLIQKKDIPIEELIPKYTNEFSKFVDLDGMKVHYQIEGSGNPIVLIHGTGSCLQTWDAWTDSLKKYYTVIRIDMPGFGLTGPRPDKDYSIKMYVKFLDDFVTKLQLDTFALAGNSLGGQICWYYTATYPEKVSKEILIDPAGFYNKKSNSLVFKLAKKKWFADIMKKSDTKLMVNNTLKEVYFDQSKISDATKQMYYDMSMRTGNREAFTDRVQSIGKDKVLNLSEINTPTLIMWGREDLLIDIALLDSFMVIPHVQKIVYEQVGHSPQEEIPTRSVEDAMNFLK